MKNIFYNFHSNGGFCLVVLATVLPVLVAVSMRMPWQLGAGLIFLALNHVTSASSRCGSLERYKVVTQWYEVVGSWMESGTFLQGQQAFYQMLVSPYVSNIKHYYYVLSPDVVITMHCIVT